MMGTINHSAVNLALGKGMAQCGQCVFYREIPLQRGLRLLCQLTGQKKPYHGMDGCRFYPGSWANLDAILGLQSEEEYGKVEVPNNTRQGIGLPAFQKLANNAVNYSAIHAAINSDCSLNHIGRSVRHAVPRGCVGFVLAREPYRPAFLF